MQFIWCSFSSFFAFSPLVCSEYVCADDPLVMCLYAYFKRTKSYLFLAWCFSELSVLSSSDFAGMNWRLCCPLRLRNWQKWNQVHICKVTWLIMLHVLISLSENRSLFWFIQVLFCFLILWSSLFSLWSFKEIHVCSRSNTS